jgi:predicted dienelactone hydrolase
MEAMIGLTGRCCTRRSLTRASSTLALARGAHLWIGMLVLICGCAAIGHPRVPHDSVSAQRLAAGRFEVGHSDYTFVDASRPNDARDGANAEKRRTLVTTVWFPRGAPGPHPLVLYSHGFLATREGGAYLAEFLARRGYVVAAPNHPLTQRWTAHGSAAAADVVHQPRDLSFVIDRILAWSDDERPFAGTIDPQRIGVMGLSLGALTATLATFHPQLRDARIGAAVSIAGPMTIFATRFFAAVPTPFLLLAGDEDVVVDYATNAPLVLERVPGGQLVSIHGGNHVGFDDASTGVLRVLPNPDVEACWLLRWSLDLSRGRDTLAELGGSTAGLLVPSEVPRPCSGPASFTALSPVRQHLIAQLAIGAFFDSAFAPTEAARAAARDYLRSDLARDLPEATYAASDRRSANGPDLRQTQTGSTTRDEWPAVRQRRAHARTSVSTSRTSDASSPVACAAARANCSHVTAPSLARCHTPSARSTSRSSTSISSESATFTTVQGPASRARSTDATSAMSTAFRRRHDVAIRVA